MHKHRRPAAPAYRCLGAVVFWSSTDLALEVGDVLEALVDRREAQVGDVVEAAQPLEHGQADPVAADLAALGPQLLLHLGRDGVDRRLVEPVRRRPSTPARSLARSNGATSPERFRTSSATSSTRS